MEGQRINVSIAGRTYRYVVKSEDQEAIIRKAAASVNEKIAQLSSIYRDRGPIDIVTIAALNEGIEKFQAAERSSVENAGYEKLSADLSNYVESLK